MALVFIGLGSNIGDGRKNLRTAWKILGTSPQVTRLGLSKPYLSESVGMASEQWFTNAVGALDTNLTPVELLDVMLGIEKKMGRDRSKGGDRIVDLDILYYNDLIHSGDKLVIPHPEMHNRLFVLMPLEELAPNHIHPVLNETTVAMRKNLFDSSDQSIKGLVWSSDK